MSAPPWRSPSAAPIRAPTVIAFDNLRRRGSEMNLPRLKAEGVRFVHGDVRSLADLAGDSSRAGPDSGVLRRALGAGRLRRFAGIPDPHQPDRLLPLPGDRPPGQGRLPVCLHQPRLSGGADQCAWLSRRPRRASACGPRSPSPAPREHGISEEFPLHGARSLIRHDETGGRTHGGRIWRRVRHPLRHRSLRPADRPVADGEGGPGSGGVLGGRALPQSRAEVHRLRRHRQTGSRLPAHRRFLRPGAGPDRQHRCLCGAALERRRRRREQPFAAAKPPRCAGKLPAARWMWLATDENRPVDLRLYITDHRAVSAVRGWTSAARRAPHRQRYRRVDRRPSRGD